jgi:hypothetical protein
MKVLESTFMPIIMYYISYFVTNPIYFAIGSK